MNIISSPCTTVVVEKSILFNDEKAVVLVDRGILPFYAPERIPSRIPSRAAAAFPETAAVHMSPSARTHHTHGWLGGYTSTVGDNVQPEPWRQGHWDHVDVHRYISRRYEKKRK